MGYTRVSIARCTVSHRCNPTTISEESAPSSSAPSTVGNWVAMNSFTQAIEELASAQKSHRGVSLYSRFLNRPAGRVLAAAAFTMRMTPNQVTLLSALVTGAGIAILTSGEPGPLRAILVTFFLMLGFALDSADGQLARLTGRGSASGEWADHVVDSAKIVAIHAGVLIMMFRFLTVNPSWYLVPLAYQLVAIEIGRAHV